MVNSELFENDEGEERPPDVRLARILATGFNYNFERAIADLIDNSIAADAKNVWIYIDPKNGEYESENAFVAVADDGHGMSETKLSEVLEYGHISSDNSKNLGRFGLGMKTASTSQSFVVAVATRETSSGDFGMRAWDIPWLEDESRDSYPKWKLRVPRSQMFPSKVLEKISDTSGTIVMLPDLSRMKSNINSLPTYQQGQVLTPKIEKCIEYLSVVFHRFLSGETLSDEYSGETVNIFVNDVLLEGWDPYLRNHSESQIMTLNNSTRNQLHSLSPTDNGAEELMLTLNGKIMKMRLHVLPKLQAWSDDFQYATGLLGWVAMQGVYVYRLDRLIQIGGWCGLMKNEVKNQLARVSLDVGREWDEILELTATKTRIIVPDNPDTFRKDLKKIFGKVRTRAREVYEAEYPASPRSPTPPETPQPPRPTPSPTPQPNPPIPTPPRTPQPNPSPPRRRLDQNTISQLFEACEDNEETRVLSRIERRARSS